MLLTPRFTFRRAMLLLGLVSCFGGLSGRHPVLANDDVEEALIVRGPDGAAIGLSAGPTPQRTTQMPGDPDTVWIGHVVGNTGLPGEISGYGPFHIGRGLNRPHFLGVPAGGNIPVTQADNGYWDFDRFNAGETDTLQGWWPLVGPYLSFVGSGASDRKRPFFGFDYGNRGNHRDNDAARKTFGVTGYWHRDKGTALATILPNTNPLAPGWTALHGEYSAWCGLRSHGDQTVVDPITGNALNAAVLDRSCDDDQRINGGPTVNGTRKVFPGYGSQWDQMLYRDFSHTAGQPMLVSFRYSTRMSDGVNTAADVRVGWFDQDPLRAVALIDGNFISSSDAGTAAPRDSFMVYVGVPVNDAACAYTSTLAPTVSYLPVYDPLRRWFSEVLRIDPQGTSPQPYYELLSIAGSTPATQFPSFTIPASVLDALGSPTIRVVFRVKTNRGWDDEDGQFITGGAGAAIVDDISVQDGPSATVLTTFEFSGDIDNLASASSAWHATGKPPGVFFHWHNLQAGSPAGYPGGLPYSDPNGGIGAPGRLCNMLGNVLTPGNHDVAGEKHAGAFGANDQDREHWIGSPTINLMASGNGPGYYNGMGLDQEIAARPNILVRFDLYGNLLDFQETAVGYRIGWQAYPAMQPNGVKCWGDVQLPPNITSSNGRLGCYYGDGGVSSGASATKGGYCITTNANGVPDSVRVYLEVVSRGYDTPITAAQFAPTTGPYSGAYIDNVALAFTSDPSPTLGILDLFQDAFPNNGSDAFVGTPPFDTLAARVRTARNTAQWTGTLMRNDIPGDSVVVTAPGPNVRMDMVFRILPGPGNYFGTIPSGAQKVGFVRKRPDANSQATASDGSFWGSYLADVGPFGGAGLAYATAQKPMGDFSGNPNKWDPNVWLSARMDTAEVNLFPCDAVVGNAARLRPGLYMSAYHESELRSNWNSGLRNGLVSPFTASADRGSFVAAHYRCILVSTSAGSAVDETNIDCSGGAGYLAKWTAAGTGYLANVGGAYLDQTISELPITSGPSLGLTKEGSKILPDGQFTAGTHIEYYFRQGLFGNFSADALLVPDPNQVLAQPGQPGCDAHRWEEFNVLPDRWKDPNYTAGALGMACMLVVDCADRRGDDPIWDRVAQTIGLTGSAKRGAGTGYWVAPDQSIPFAVAGLLPTQKVSDNLGQRGSLYDFYQVRGGESYNASGRLGSRYSAAGIGLATGKTATSGPTRLILRSYYRNVLDLAGDLRAAVYGPTVGFSDDDIGLRTDFMTNATGTASPRAMIAIGRNLVAGQVTTHPTYFPTYFGATFRADGYSSLSGNSLAVAELIPAPTLLPLNPGAIFGVVNGAWLSNDVLNVNGAVSGATAAAFYENPNPPGLGPYVAAVFAPAGGGRLANTLVQGWTLGLSSGYPNGGQGSKVTVGAGGTHVYWLNALTRTIGTVCGQPLSAPVGVGDSPGSAGLQLPDFFELGSENPARGEAMTFAFRLQDAEHVQVCVYDVSGRKVRVLADRPFEAGKEHLVRWDGVDGEGRRVPRGVYFCQLRSTRYTSQKKLVLLRGE